MVQRHFRDYHQTFAGNQQGLKVHSQYDHSLKRRLWLPHVSQLLLGLKKRR